MTGAAGMGGVMLRPIFIGLDWLAVEAIADCLGINMTPRMFARIRFLEGLEMKRLNKGD